ncbi:LysR family transcriptional regulator [Mesorhizobium loti]|nr:LysR family transcriptional regulator [Mesorhizobium loti]
MLDLESVRLFVLVVDLGSLTRAAEAAGTVQPVVSQRLKALEAALGRKVLERTPRFVRLTQDGAIFLPRARDLLSAHDEATRFSDEPAFRFAIGLSDHALGLGAGQVLRKIRATLPLNASIEVRVGISQSVLQLFDDGEVDVAVLRRERGGVGGEVLGTDPLGWRAADGWTLSPGQSVPLALLGAPCGVRATAIKQLESAQISWRESFTGGSCAALLAGVQAGIGVAPMGRIASGGLPDIGPACGLPTMPASEIVLYARASSPKATPAIRGLAGAVQSSLK